MAYKPIEDYGVIGDLHSLALVGKDGSIDWCCLPHFDSPSLFAALLDERKGGFFRVASAGEAVRRQMYFPETCILVTRFLTPDGIGEVVDFMTVSEGAEDAHRHEVVRIARAATGTVRFRLECRPAFDYARARHRLELSRQGAVFRAGKERVGLTSGVPLQASRGGVSAEFTLREGQRRFFLLRRVEPGGDKPVLEPGYGVDAAFQHTCEFWRSWVSRIRYQGRWREMVQRSAMTLKLLTFKPTGAIVAAPTTSLPETIGGERNFDYRYAWIRDAAFSVYAFLRLGCTKEAEEFISWVGARAREEARDGSLQIMYGLHGEHELPEAELAHLEGYRRSGPVRVGNAAAEQLQLDIYGELLDAVYLHNKHSRPISHELWTHLRRSLDYVCRNWRRADEGIWEVRGGRRHFVFSKLMCWVALDRGLRLMLKRSFPGPETRFKRERDRIYEEIMRRGWSEERGSFVQHYGGKALDASNLIMPLVFFISPVDPRMAGTLDATRRSLGRDSLIHRYRPREAAHDGFTGTEGSFSMCTFWLVECLTRAGRLEEARLLFEKMHSYANHLGLYSEQIGPTGEFLGNFPQALTHMSLISAAFNLDRALGARRDRA